MSLERDIAHGHWPPPARRIAGRGSYRYLLDLDPELAEELDMRRMLAARSAVTARTVEFDPGEIDLSAWLAESAGGPGVLVLSGILANQVRVGDRVAVELIGAGDLIQPAGSAEAELVGADVTRRALLPARLALLDAAFSERVRGWPQITRVLLRRVSASARNLNVQRAIAAQPRLEVRLALLLWHLAERWGKVEPGGVRLPVPLTHQLLGRLVGAERPSVSHALARLAQAELVTGHGDDWHLHGTPQQQLAAMLEHECRPSQLPSAQVLRW